MPDQQIEVEITARVDSLERELRGVQTQLDRTGRSADQRSRQMSQNFQRAGVALAGIGVAAVGVGRQAVGLANEFETNMAQIQGLVGVAADEVDGMRDSVLGLSGTTARSPQELSAALFTVTSAGLRGDDAMGALEGAARLAAAGMGETRDIAQAAAGLMNAYASSGLEAGEAMDFLAATARAGNFEASQLAGSLGQVTPIASTLGVSTGDLGGSIALLTRTSGNASQAITQVRAVMNAMLRPSGEASQILADFGITGQDVRDTLQEDGLVAALELLEQAAGGDQEAFAALLGSSEAIGGALSILDADAQTLADTFGAVENSTGVADDAFNAVAETSAFQMQQAMTDITTSLTELGTAIAVTVAPVISAFADGVGFLVDAFLSLPGPIQTVITAMGALAIPVGAGLAAWGRYGDSIRGAISNFRSGEGAMGSLGNAARTLGTAIRGHPVAFGLGAAAAVTAGVIYARWRRQQEEARERARGLTQAVQDQAGSVPNLTARITELNEEYQALQDETTDTEGAVQDLGAEMDNFLVNLADMGQDGGTEFFAGLSSDVRDDLVPAMQTGTDEFAALQDEIGRVVARGLEGEDALAALRSEFEDLEGPVGDAVRGLIDASDGSVESMLSMQDLADALDETADSYDDVSDDSRDAAREQILLAQAAGTLTDAQALANLEAIDGAENYADLQDVLQNVVTQQERNISAAEGLAAGTHDLAGNVTMAGEEMLKGSRSAEDMGEAVEEAAVEVESFAEAGAAAAEEATRLAESGELMSESLGGVAEVLSEVESLLDSINGVQQSYDEAILETIESQEAFAESLLDSEGNLISLGEEVTTLQALQTEAGREAITGARDLATAIQEETLARIANGESAADALAASDALINGEGGLRAQLEAIGLTDESIDELIATYAEVPDSVATEMEAETRDAEEAAQEVIDLLLEYGELTPEALLDAEPRLAEEQIGIALAAVHGFDAEEATAALFGDASEFDSELAASVLALADFDAQEVDALLQGDAAQLDATLRIALADLAGFDVSQAEADLDADNTDAVSALIGYELLAMIFGARRDTAQLDADVDTAAMNQADRELTNTANPGGSPRRANLDVNLRGEGAARRELNQLDNTRTQTTNVRLSGYYTALGQLDRLDNPRHQYTYIHTIRVGAAGAINEDRPGGAARPAAGVFNGPMMLFGEAGPESFIPLSPERRSTAVPILAETAARMGFQLLARGGIIGASVAPNPRGSGVPRTFSQTEGAGGTTTIDLTINNPAPEPASTSLPLAMRRLATQGVTVAPTRLSNL